MIENDLFGVVPIVPTPFREDEEIDEDALRRLIDFAIAGGIKAVCLPAYASEFYKLSDDEKLRVVKIAVEHAGSARPRAAGTDGQHHQGGQSGECAHPASLSRAGQPV